MMMMDTGEIEARARAGATSRGARYWDHPRKKMLQSGEGFARSIGSRTASSEATTTRWNSVQSRGRGGPAASILLWAAGTFYGRGDGKAKGAIVGLQGWLCRRHRGRFDAQYSLHAAHEVDGTSWCRRRRSRRVPCLARDAARVSLESGSNRPVTGFGWVAVVWAPWISVVQNHRRWSLTLDVARGKNSLARRERGAAITRAGSPRTPDGASWAGRRPLEHGSRARAYFPTLCDAPGRRYISSECVTRVHLSLSTSALGRLRRLVVLPHHFTLRVRVAAKVATSPLDGGASSLERSRSTSGLAQRVGRTSTTLTAGEAARVDLRRWRCPPRLLDLGIDAARDHGQRDRQPGPTRARQIHAYRGADLFPRAGTDAHGNVRSSFLSTSRKYFFRDGRDADA